MKQQERLLLIGLAIGVSLMLIMRDVFGVSVSKYMYLVYVIALMAVAKYETMIYMVCFILPLVCGLPGTYMMPCVLLMLFIKKNKLRAWQVVMVLFVVIAEVFSSLWYQTVYYTKIVQYVSFAGVMLFLSHDESELDYLMCVRMYMLGIVVLCSTIMTTAIMTAPSDWTDMFAEGEFRFGSTQKDALDGMKLVLNANSLAYYSITGISCGVLLAEKTKKGERLFFIACVLITAIAGMLTVSRTWLIVVGIGVILYILSKVKYPRRFLIALAAVVLVIYGTLWLLGEATAIVEAFTNRLNFENMDSAGGRTEIFQRYMELFWQNTRVMFLGTGVTQYSEVLGERKAMHNGLQQILVCYGVLGCVVMIVALIKPIANACAGRQRDITTYIPLVGITLFVQSIQFLSPHMLMLPYAIGIYALKCAPKKKTAQQAPSLEEHEALRGRMMR